METAKDLATCQMTVRLHEAFLLLDVADMAKTLGNIGGAFSVGVGHRLPNPTCI